DPDPGCDYPLADVSLGGPLVVAKNTAETFAAGASPSNATLPITFLWEATDQAPEPMIVNTRTTYNDYTWPTAGSKTISVTAENCAGSATAYQAVQVVDPVNLPDLFISTAWIAMDEGRIYYVMHNGGNTAVPAGVYVGLRVGPNTVATAEHPQPLAPGGLGVGYLDYAWTCAGTTASVAVEADWGEDIAETDESNNSWTSIWTCDQRPPEFVSGPEVVDITETRVRVEWTMDEACVGWVEYDTSVYDPVPFQEQDSTAYLTSHDVTLTGLTAGTTYYARALCEDAAGLGVNSQAVTFDTAPPGSDPPVIHTLTLEQAPHAYYEFWQAVVEVEDGSFMDRVACSLDGTSLGVDYSPDTDGAYPRYLLYLSPYDMGLTRDQVFGQPHQLICTAYRQDPSAFTTQQQTVGFPGDPAPPPYLWIEEPHPYYKIFVPGSIVPAGTQLDVVVSAAAHEWACTASGFSGDLPPGLGPVKCDDLAPLPVDSVELWFDGVLKDTVTPGPSDTVHTLTADLTATVLGEYEYRVAATVGARTDEDSRSLVVEQGQAGVDVTRSVRREGNLLKVTLDVENNGTVDAIIPRIVDRAFGLQPILGSYDLGDVRYDVEISGVDWYENTGGRDLDIRLNFYLEQPNGESRLRLAPGASTSVSYMLVPELHEIDTPARLGKGWHVNYPNTIAEYLDVWVYGPQGFQPQSIDLSETLVNDPAYGMLPLNDAIAHAIRTADYVLVTSPHAIYAYMAEQGDEVPDDDAERLFSNMAELASLESGVLGFLRHAYTQPLDDLLEPGNDSWSDRLAPSFEEVDKGYVLIVGETEIVAAHYVGEDNLVTYAGIPDHVHDSDLWYAHTAGSTARPELVVGRVIGNDLDVLNTYLDNILRALRGEAGYGFFRSRAYVCNGNGSGEWTFQDDGEQVDNQLDVRYDTSTWRNFMGDDDEAQKAIHLQLLPDRDLVLYRGHGNQDAWDDGLLASDVLAGVYDLGDRNPAMLAAACKTGNYETQNDLNLAEVLLAQGAGTYVGATEISERWANSDAFVNLVPKWQADESMGQALNQVKRKIWGMEWAFDNRKLWAYEYNLYGDPKYASMEAATTAAEDETLVVTAEPQGVNLLVNLPDLEARLVDGDHVVQIPGGGTLAELGAYPVPVWTLSLDFRPGQQVQDVQLVNRAGMVVTGSLSLPVVTAEIDCGCLEAAATPDSAVKGWYPTMDRAFAWSVEKQPNGASTLQIVLYPFHYHSATGDAVYYRSYKLSVATLDASAQVESLRVTGRGYDPGDRVPLALVLDSEARQDLVVQPSVRTLGTNKVLGGLPMRTLHAVAGTATVDLTWNTHGYGAGDYQIVVELLDPDGQRLDTAVAEVTLGRAGARLTSLTASQDYFGPGDQIGLALTVQNTGTLSLDGTAVFQVQRTGDLSVTQTLTVPVRGLAPGASKKVSATWDTTGAEARRYRVIGTFKFYSQATDPRDLVLYRPTVYLPVVTRIP
ncbi:MAG: C25 family cysteine peptidase, partial [Anaerolineae bacterium]